MDINSTFPSRWIKATDLGSKSHAVTIQRVTMEEFQDGTSKPAIWFHGKEKGMILNKTNATAIADVLGGETDAWTDKAIEIFSMKVQGPNGLTDGIRVRVPEPKAKTIDTTPDDLNDDIPF